MKSIGADNCLCLLGKILKLVIEIMKVAVKLSARIHSNYRLGEGMHASKLFQ